ncbi:toxin HipA [Betaproteobacteria bacterium]|nr:toxin HipA [Betaproteobacteria bacterium]
MKKLRVRYCGWGEDWSLGQLADDGSTMLFEYASEALAQGLELSPLHLKVSAQTHGRFPDFLQRLPGLFADSLPDGWGLMLMDRLFRARGLRYPDPLDRLAFMGNRAMGAFSFEPADETDADVAPDWSLLAVAEEAQRALMENATDEAIATLRKLALTGGSPQGARPKALVRYQPEREQISTRADAAGEAWLVKFQAQGEHKEVCAIEQLYADLARAAGLAMPTSRYFDLSNQLAAFGVARFDRIGEWRIPMHSLAGLLQVDFRIPGATDYTALLRATRLLTRDEREVGKAYVRAVFNALFHNRDDHPKNFAWCLNRERRWLLAPAFDLTFSAGPGGQHHMDYCGEGSSITSTHLLRLAAEGGVDQRFARQSIERLAELAGSLRQRLSDYPIRHATGQTLIRAIEQCRKNMIREGKKA